MPRATCPNDASHSEFITVAHVTEDWVVDRAGNFLEKYGYDQETVAGPDSGNEWTCKVCGAVAKVED